MTRIACIALALLVANTALAANEDPTVELCKEVLLEIKHNPEHPDALIALRPLTVPKTPAHRAILEDILSFLENSAREKPENFWIAHNYYLAVWIRYLWFGAEADAAAAFERLNKAASLAAPQSDESARCAFERAENTATLKDQALRQSAIAQHEAATQGAKAAFEEKRIAIFKAKEGDLAKMWLAAAVERRDEAVRLRDQALQSRDAALKKAQELRSSAIDLFVAAKRTAMSKGYYAARSALALANLHAENGAAANAKKLAREALELDETRGYVRNYAYDQLGLLALAEGNTDGALVMLETAAKVEPDEDILALGYAHRLARALIDAGRPKEATDYLAAAAKIAAEGKAALTADFVYTLALGYTKLKQPDPALMYWKQYLDMSDPDEPRRIEAKKMAQELAISTPPLQP